MPSAQGHETHEGAGGTGEGPDYRAPGVLTTEFELCLKDSEESLKYNQRGKTIMF